MNLDNSPPLCLGFPRCERGQHRGKGWRSSGRRADGRVASSGDRSGRKWIPFLGRALLRGGLSAAGVTRGALLPPSSPKPAPSRGGRLEAGLQTQAFRWVPPRCLLVKSPLRQRGTEVSRGFLQGKGVRGSGPRRAAARASSESPAHGGPGTPSPPGSKWPSQGGLPAPTPRSGLPAKL